MKLAIIAITKNGSVLARRLKELCPEGADVYLPGKFIEPGEKGVRPLSENLAGEAGRLFGRYKGLIFIMATGIVVRLITPLLIDKRKDPAVVVMDEKGRHAISLLSGHAGGANALAEEIAGLTGAEAIITTASDTQGTLAVDTLAEKLGCAVEDFGQAKKVTAAIVNGEPVAVCSYRGISILKGAFKELPDNLKVYAGMEGIGGSGPGAAIIITPYMLPQEALDGMGAVAFLRPKVLVVGMGCNRGTTGREIAGLYKKTLNKHALSPLSVRNIATIKDKQDEAGLLSFAKKLNLSVDFISRERLGKAATPSGPSGAVFKNMGVYGVCEPAALLSAGAERLLVPKEKSKNATIAVAEAGLP